MLLDSEYTDLRCIKSIHFNKSSLSKRLALADVKVLSKYPFYNDLIVG
jgi:hypothetical protein